MDANPAASAAALRPLGIGEILDRAVNLCVKHFVQLGLIYVVYMIPAAFVQYSATAKFSDALQTITTASRTGASPDSAAILRSFGAAGALDPLTVAGIFLLVFLAPLPIAALIDATSALYLGGVASFGHAYRTGLARYAQLLGVSVLYAVAGGLLGFVIVLGIVAISFAVGFLYSQIPGLGIALGVLLGIVAFVGLLVFIMLVTLAIQVSFVICVVERANFAAGFSRSFGRLFSKIGRRRAAIVAFALFAISIGISIVAAVGQSSILLLTHSAAVAVTYTSIVRVISAAFTTTLVVVFYYDVRVREDGLDLQLAAASSLAAEPAAALAEPSGLPPSP